MCDPIAVDSKESAGAPDAEIEITATMIEAGLVEFDLFDPGFSNPCQKVADIFEAMYSVYRKSRCRDYPKA